MAGAQNGYHYIRWMQDGMTFWAVSDVAAPAQHEFVDLWRMDGGRGEADPK